MCEVASEFHQDLGCTISVADRNVYGNASPKSFFSSFMRKNKKSGDRNSKNSKKSKQADNTDEKTAELIQQLKLEGRSDSDIAMHLSFIHDVKPAVPPSPKKRNVISQLFSELSQAFSLTEILPIPPEFTEARFLTVSISTAPFFGALPPVMDMSFDEYASLAPVYAPQCVNHLPVHKHDGTPLPGDQTNCAICLGEFTKGEKLKSLPCVHFYHQQCIDTWLMVGHACPVCKTLVQ